MKKQFTYILFLVVLVISVVTGCKHHPIIPNNNNPIDTTKIDTTKITPPPSNPKDSVCFDEEILPILLSNCAMSGCHDPATAEEGIVLNNYANVQATISSKKLTTYITTTTLSKRMPPPPMSALSQTQIDLIKKWIAEGRKQGIDCGKGCDTNNVTFSKTISPMIQTNCQGCHSNSNTSGGINLEGYTNVKTSADLGSLLGTITHASGYSPMPKGGNRMSDCNIAQLKIWLKAGAPNN